MTTFGIIGAMDIEVQTLIQAMEQEGSPVSQHLIAGREFVEGTLCGTPCVVVQCGVGMVNAALCTQALIDHFQPSYIVNTGVAGSLDATIDIGDVVIATDALNSAMDVQNLGYAPGQTPGLDCIAFPADETLGQALANCATSCGHKAHVGRIASSDRFVRESKEKEFLQTQFAARCCEMEGAAIAQVCWLNEVPWAILRAISDKADGSDALDYPIFEERAARASATIIEALLATFLGPIQ